MQLMVLPPPPNSISILQGWLKGLTAGRKVAGQVERSGARFLPAGWWWWLFAIEESCSKHRGSRGHLNGREGLCRPTLFLFPELLLLLLPLSASIFPSPDQPANLPLIPSALNTGGSLPDLTSLHFPSPLPTPLDPEESAYPSLSGGGSTSNLANTMTHLGISGGMSLGHGYDPPGEALPATQARAGRLLVVARGAGQGVVLGGLAAPSACQSPGLRKGSLA